MTVFTLKAQLSFKTVAQVSYVDENGYTKIVRFYSDTWVREIVSYSLPEHIDLKIFVHSPNLCKEEKVKLSIYIDQKEILSKDFPIVPNNDFAGWFQLTWTP